ncbi:hypothetical protein MMC11_000644 [Xylographa trunciseda]|nr:hypothetical protein [Xylographa trunciseda]
MPHALQAGNEVISTSNPDTEVTLKDRLFSIGRRSNESLGELTTPEIQLLKNTEPANEYRALSPHYASKFKCEASFPKPKMRDVRHSDGVLEKEILGNEVIEMMVDHNIASYSMNGNSEGSTPSVDGEEASDVDAESVGLEKPGSKQPLSSSQRVGKVSKLLPAKMLELTSSLDAFPLHVSRPSKEDHASSELLNEREKDHRTSNFIASAFREPLGNRDANGRRISAYAEVVPAAEIDSVRQSPMISPLGYASSLERPSASSRALSTPTLMRSQSSSKLQQKGQSLQSQFKSSNPIPNPLDFDKKKTPYKSQARENFIPAPEPSSLPLPPLSLPAFLHLELSSEERPSPVFIHRPASSDFPYEPSHVKIERLLNFLLLPPLLEQVLWFGAIACLDAWLYTFTILPLRFLKAISILGSSRLRNVTKEAGFLAGFIYLGSGRFWRRRVQRRGSIISEKPEQTGNDKTDAEPLKRVQKNETDVPTSSESENPSATHSHPYLNRRRPVSTSSKHRRTKSVPSKLMPSDKADILRGLLIILSCWILMYFDASMMYHSIRGQAAIKLYVIYNVLEVCDRLLSALGQDVLECLFSKETLERNPDGRSKVWRPFWLFILALLYNLLHSTALFYQVITLNVAVNSYSNALLTLLMSNQFVEIKSTVFKKFEKDNLFQITCADVVERFQLWLMLMIIAARNIIETNSLGGSSVLPGSTSPSSSIPIRSSSMLPFSFTVLPDWIGQVLSPFLLVLGTEMLVDWLKHAYINKFNNIKPNIYGRFLDVLAKDYYSNAFADQNLIRRLGLPVIPLCCLFIRASVQTYHMFLTTAVSAAPDPTTSLAAMSSAYHPSQPTVYPLPRQLDHLVSRLCAFARVPYPATLRAVDTDAWLATLATLTAFLTLYLVLLAVKLLLGMCLLSFSRARYGGMKVREALSSTAEGKRLGGWGVVEVDEEKRRWIYDDDGEGLRRRVGRGKEVREEEMERKKEKGFGGVRRYDMVAKRIW